MARIQDARTMKLESDRFEKSQELSQAEMELIRGGLGMTTDSEMSPASSGRKSVVCNDYDCSDGCCTA